MPLLSPIGPPETTPQPHHAVGGYGTQNNGAIVQQNAVADPHIVRESPVHGRGAAVIADCFLSGDDKSRTGRERAAAFVEFAKADFGPLQVEKDANRNPACFSAARTVSILFWCYPTCRGRY